MESIGNTDTTNITRQQNSHERTSKISVTKPSQTRQICALMIKKLGTSPFSKHQSIDNGLGERLP